MSLNKFVLTVKEISGSVDVILSILLSKLKMRLWKSRYRKQLRYGNTSMNVDISHMNSMRVSMRSVRD